MVVSPKANLMFLSKAKSPSSPYISVTMDLGSHIVAKATNAALNTQKTEDRIKQMFSNLELSISSYDTAWVAMVPSPDSAQYPCFPKCLEWLLNNQHSDGSWSPHCHPMLIKDSLSSTLASVLALKRWNVAEETMKRGLHYIEANSGSVNDEKQQSPIGFDIIFAGMIDYANELGLNLPLSLTLVDELRHRRDMEIKRVQEVSHHSLYMMSSLAGKSVWMLFILGLVMVLLPSLGNYGWSYTMEQVKHAIDAASRESIELVRSKVVITLLRGCWRYRVTHKKN